MSFSLSNEAQFGCNPVIWLWSLFVEKGGWLFRSSNKLQEMRPAQEVLKLWPRLCGPRLFLDAPNWQIVELARPSTKSVCLITPMAASLPMPLGLMSTRLR
jgi:hypothetical protein